MPKIKKTQAELRAWEKNYFQPSLEIQEYIKQLKKFHSFPVNSNNTMLTALYNQTNYLEFLIDKAPHLRLYGKPDTIDLQAADENGENLLFYAIRGDAQESLAYLLRKGVNIHKKNFLDETPYVFALRLGKADIAQQLVNFDPAVTEINLASIQQNYSLHKVFIYALNVGEEYQASIEYFLQLKNHDINTKEPFGVTPLQYMLDWLAVNPSVTTASVFGLRTWPYYKIISDFLTYAVQKKASLSGESMSMQHLLPIILLKYPTLPFPLHDYIKSTAMFNPRKKDVDTLKENDPISACLLYVAKAKYHYFYGGRDPHKYLCYLEKAQAICPEEFTSPKANTTPSIYEAFKDNERIIIDDFLKKDDKQKLQSIILIYKGLKTYGTFSADALTQAGKGKEFLSELAAGFKPKLRY